MNKYIMIVDDNPSDLVIASSMVESEGHAVVKATNGYEALDLLEEYDCCLFIVDLQMPQMGGLELIKRIKRVEKYKKCPILVTSARNETKDVKLAIVAGASDYLVKPLDLQIFNQKFSKLLGRNLIWKDYDVPEDSSYSEGFVKAKIRIVSINEVSMTIESDIAYIEGESLELGGAIFGVESTISTSVDSVIKKTNGYHCRLSFVGMTEKTRKTIRLTCRSLWNLQNNKQDWESHEKNEQIKEENHG